jgi:hypothetical protein
MPAPALVRIASDMVRASRTQFPFALRQYLAAATAARDPHVRPFLRDMLADCLRYTTQAVVPVEGETLERAALAARWLARAQDGAGDDGLSYGYFPTRTTRGWQPSYPETSGYTIPTLFDYAALTHAAEYHDRAVRMASFAARCQTASGGIRGGTVATSPTSPPVAFNTGTALLGFVAAYRNTGDERFAVCTRRAAEFLISDMAPEGHLRSHGPFVHKNGIMTYSSLCAWPLWLAAEDTGDQRFAEAALRLGDAALGQQQPSGWFAHNCLSAQSHAPLLHTVAYTVQGLVELGIRSGQTKYVTGAAKAVGALLPYCRDGFLHGRWYEDWRPAALSSCLTGSAQMGVVCYRLARHTGDQRYRSAADSVVNYLKALQPIDAADDQLIGGLGGSFPLIGRYMPLGFPGWATKFYLDALMLQHACAEDDAVAQRPAAGAPLATATCDVLAP